MICWQPMPIQSEAGIKEALIMISGTATYKKTAYLLLSILLGLLLLLIVTESARAQEDSVDLIGTATGHLKITTEAVGLLDTGDATITIDVPGTPMTVALTWNGRGPTGDDTVTINVNGSGNQSVTADMVEQYSANCCNSDQYVYFKLLPASMFNSGINTVYVTDLTINESHGVVLDIVSEDAAFPRRKISRYWGLDGFFVHWTGVFGPNSQVVCDQFEPQTFDREMNFAMAVGGVLNPFRPNRIWYMVGSGAPPTGNIVGIGTAISTSNDGSGNRFPLYSTQNQNGHDEQDLFKETIAIPTNSTYACFQIESYDVDGLLGVSALWHGLVTDLEMPPDKPTAITLVAASASGSGPSGTLLLVVLFTMILLAGFAVVARARARVEDSQ